MLHGKQRRTEGRLGFAQPHRRLNVDWPDPENRDFKHPEPIKWTLDHRGEILAALYTILLGNPRHRQAAKDRSQAKTRFKAWWRLIGSAIEHAASVAQPDEAVDFTKIFAEVEAKDEESATTADMLKELREVWPDAEFKAGDVLTFESQTACCKILDFFWTYLIFPKRLSIDLR